MKKNLLFITYSLLLVYLMGCATTHKSASNAFKERVFAGTYQETFNAIIKSLQDAKYGFAIQNPKNGDIQTEWRPEYNLLAGLFIGKLHSKILVNQSFVDSTHTKVHVEIVVQKEVKGGKWEIVGVVREKDYLELFNGMEENLKEAQKKTE